MAKALAIFAVGICAYIMIAHGSNMWVATGVFVAVWAHNLEYHL